MKCDSPICRVHHRHHVAVSRHATAEVVLVGSGPRSYLWIGGGRLGVLTASVSGPATLRKLAKAILAEVGDE